MQTETPLAFRAKHKEVKSEGTDKKEQPLRKMVIQGVVSGVTRHLCSWLMNPRTWSYMAVKLPEWSQRFFDLFVSD